MLQWDAISTNWSKIQYTINKNPLSILHWISQVYSKIFTGQEYNKVQIYPAEYKKTYLILDNGFLAEAEKLIYRMGKNTGKQVKLIWDVDIWQWALQSVKKLMDST